MKSEAVPATLPRVTASFSLGHENETITKWGLRGFLFLVSTPLHPRVPATKCRAQIIV
jgi:hypothetical protein